MSAPPDDVRSDAQLLDAARAGDAAAFWQLAEPRRAYLKALAGRILRDRLPTDNSDVVGSSLERACACVAQFKGTSAQEFLGWLTAIARNEALKALRRAKRLEPLAEVGGNEPLADSTALGERASRRERSALLLAAVDRLPDDYRRVIQLRNLRELPHEEVARQMGRSPDAVRQLWCRAFRRLKEELGALS
jgi:RNA polymerase sigma-70 factor (ECF subfamily)